MINLDSILKSRDITLSTKFHLVKAMVFPVFMYRRESWMSWTTKKDECQRIDTFVLWCCRRLLRDPTRKGNQSWIFTGSTDAVAETAVFGHLMWRIDSLEKIQWIWGRLKAGGEGDDRGWDGWVASPTRWTWVWVSFRSWWWTGRPGVLQSMGSQRVGHGWVTELDWNVKDEVTTIWEEGLCDPWLSPGFWDTESTSTKREEMMWVHQSGKLCASKSTI